MVVGSWRSKRECIFMVYGLRSCVSLANQSLWTAHSQLRGLIVKPLLGNFCKTISRFYKNGFANHYLRGQHHHLGRHWLNPCICIGCWWGCSWRSGISWVRLDIPGLANSVNTCWPVNIQGGCSWRYQQKLFTIKAGLFCCSRYRSMREMFLKHISIKYQYSGKIS